MPLDRARHSQADETVRESHRGHFKLRNRINRLANDTDQSLTMIALDNILSHNGDNVSGVFERNSQIKVVRMNRHASRVPKGHFSSVSGGRKVS